MSKKRGILLRSVLGTVMLLMVLLGAVFQPERVAAASGDLSTVALDSY